MKHRQLINSHEQLLLPAPSQKTVVQHQNINIDDVINYLQKQKNQSNMEELLQEREALLNQQDLLKRHAFHLFQKYEEKKNIFQKIVDKYEVIISKIENSVPKERKIIH